MPPAIAEHAIAIFTRPSDLVLDPDCGAGTTIVEALRGGRHAIGLTAQCSVRCLAYSNITRARARGAPVDGMVLVLDRPTGAIGAAQAAGFTGRVDLLLTALHHVGPAGDPADALDRLTSLLVACRPLMRPGGHVVITTVPHRHPRRHDLIDLAGPLLASATKVGLVPVARCLALTARLRGRRVITRTQRRSATQLRQTTGVRSTLPAHHTALVFRVDPDIADTAHTLPVMPQTNHPRHPHRARTR